MANPWQISAGPLVNAASFRAEARQSEPDYAPGAPLPDADEVRHMARQNARLAPRGARWRAERLAKLPGLGYRCLAAEVPADVGSRPAVNGSLAG